MESMLSIRETAANSLSTSEAGELDVGSESESEPQLMASIRAHTVISVSSLEF